MATIKLEAGIISTLLSTELNSLANNGKVLSAAIDNATDLDIVDDLVLSTATFSSAPSAGAVCEVWILPALDGTNYADGASTTDAASSDLVGHFNIRASTAAQVHVIRRVNLPPVKFKYLIRNSTGQAFNASGSSLKRLPSRYQSA